MDPVPCTRDADFMDILRTLGFHFSTLDPRDINNKRFASQEEDLREDF